MHHVAFIEVAGLFSFQIVVTIVQLSVIKHRVDFDQILR